MENAAWNETGIDICAYWRIYRSENPRPFGCGGTQDDLEGEIHYVYTNETPLGRTATEGDSLYNSVRISVALPTPQINDWTGRNVTHGCFQGTPSPIPEETDFEIMCRELHGNTFLHPVPKSGVGVRDNAVHQREVGRSVNGSVVSPLYLFRNDHCSSERRRITERNPPYLYIRIRSSFGRNANLNFGKINRKCWICNGCACGGNII